MVPIPHRVSRAQSWYHNENRTYKDGAIYVSRQCKKCPQVMVLYLKCVQAV